MNPCRHPRPGPDYWDWRCLECGLAVNDHRRYQLTRSQQAQQVWRDHPFLFGFIALCLLGTAVKYAALLIVIALIGVPSVLWYRARQRRQREQDELEARAQEEYLRDLREPPQPPSDPGAYPPYLS